MVEYSKADGTKTKSRVGLIVILVTLVVAIVALVVGIVVNLEDTNTGRNEDEWYSVNIKEEANAYHANDLANSIIEKFDSENHSMDDVESDFAELIDSLNDGEKIYAIAPYAYFVFNQTGDIDKSIEIMKSANRYVGGDTMVSYYDLIGRLYEKAGMYDQSVRYYNMALEARGEE